MPENGSFINRILTDDDINVAPDSVNHVNGITIGISILLYAPMLFYLLIP